MLLKRYIPLFIVTSVGLLILCGHFINNDSLLYFVDNDATQWFDIIASFAILLGALNMLKLQLLKIIKIYQRLIIILKIYNIGESAPNVSSNIPATPCGEPSIGSGNFSTSKNNK